MGSLSLGTLVALVEHRLGEWLDAAADGAEDCEWNPHCSEHDGACMACLHLSFGCDHLNERLERAVLLGSPERDDDKLTVDVGFWETLPPVPWARPRTPPRRARARHRSKAERRSALGGRRRRRGRQRQRADGAARAVTRGG